MDVGPICTHAHVIAAEGVGQGLVELEPMAIVPEHLHILLCSIGYHYTLRILWHLHLKRISPKAASDGPMDDGQPSGTQDECEEEGSCDH